MLALGNKRPLNAADLWPLCTTEKANVLCDRFDDIWAEEAAKPNHEYEQNYVVLDNNNCGDDKSDYNI